MNSGFFYKSAEEREKLVLAERDFIEKRVQKVIDLKKKLCNNTDKRFVVINQKVRHSIVSCSVEVFLLTVKQNSQLSVQFPLLLQTAVFQ